jgi:hypothetical protein
MSPIGVVACGDGERRALAQVWAGCWVCLDFDGWLRALVGWSLRFFVVVTAPKYFSVIIYDLRLVLLSENAAASSVIESHRDVDPRVPALVLYQAPSKRTFVIDDFHLSPANQLALFNHQPDAINLHHCVAPIAILSSVVCHCVGNESTRVAHQPPASIHPSNNERTNE